MEHEIGHGFNGDYCTLGESIEIIEDKYQVLDNCPLREESIKIELDNENRS